MGGLYALLGQQKLLVNRGSKTQITFLKRIFLLLKRLATVEVAENWQSFLLMEDIIVALE